MVMQSVHLKVHGIAESNTATLLTSTFFVHMYYTLCLNELCNPFSFFNSHLFACSNRRKYAPLLYFESIMLLEKQGIPECYFLVVLKCVIQISLKYPRALNTRHCHKPSHSLLIHVNKTVF